MKGEQGVMKPQKGLHSPHRPSVDRVREGAITRTQRGRELREGIAWWGRGREDGHVTGAEIPKPEQSPPLCPAGRDHGR